MKTQLQTLTLILLLLLTATNCEKITPETVFDEETANPIPDHSSDDSTEKVIDRTYYCQTGSGGTDIHTKTKRYTEKVIFKGGDNGYHSFRIPAIIRAGEGILIAFCEGRKNSEEDYGNIDVVYKRSTDNGVTWGPLKVLFNMLNGTCGNPTPVYNNNTNTVWVFMSYNDEFHSHHGTDSIGSKPGLKPIKNWGERRVYSIKSDDNGATWKDLTDRTNELLPPGYTWDAVGPGNGIQLKHGPYAGRLIVPAIGRNIYSDDAGATWNYQLINPGTSEGTIVELCNGDLMRNDRGAPPLKQLKRRQISISSDLGVTWSEWKSHDQLLDPVCQASSIRYNEDYPARLLFINPADDSLRKNMVVRISYDEGKTWARQRQLDANKGGYSSMAKTQDFQVGSLQEKGKDSQGRHSIIFRKFNLPWILNGKKEPVN